MAQATVRVTGTEAGELPAAFCATTTKVTLVPEVRPVTVQEVDALWHWVPVLAVTM